VPLQLQISYQLHLRVLLDCIIRLDYIIHALLLDFCELLDLNNDSRCRVLLIEALPRKA